MKRLHAVRETIRDEFEQKIAKEKGTNKMNVVEFQIQMKHSGVTAKEFLHEIDPAAPIPQAVEGGDGKGPLYQCVLDAQKLVPLKTLVEERGFFLYRRPLVMKLEETHYRRDWYVQWTMGEPPRVCSQP